MLVTMVFHHQSDRSFSHCMVGSSNTILLCFLFFVLVLTMIVFYGYHNDFSYQSDVSLSYCMVGSSNTNLLCFLFFVYGFESILTVVLFSMLVTMVFHHQNDVSWSFSYCMVGSSNTNLLCFLFSFIVLTMIAGCKYFQCS